ncbi:MAG: hypothetical protein J7L10_00085 [Methanomicrobia archaeon]|nr:hypothetical protein [Methanomicrobia archaeon]RLF95447.1 MAG: hypothetical protein DRN50_03720 [Thermococci archaeon]
MNEFVDYAIGSVILFLLSVELFSYILRDTQKEYKNKVMYTTVGDIFGLLGYMLLIVFVISASGTFANLWKLEPMPYVMVARSTASLLSLILYTGHIIFKRLYGNEKTKGRETEYYLTIIFQVLGYLFYLMSITSGGRF